MEKNVDEPFHLSEDCDIWFELSGNSEAVDEPFHLSKDCDSIPELKHLFQVDEPFHLSEDCDNVGIGNFDILVLMSLSI